MRIWVARVAALLALLGAATAIFVAVTSVEANDELTVSEAQEAAERLNAVNGPVGRLLEELEPGKSPADAQNAVRTALEETREMIEDGNGDGSLAERLDAALSAELKYLDALGSTLNNPRSALKGTIGARAVELRDQLKSTPGADEKLVRGGAELVAYSDARIE